jgi:cytochrome c553
MVVFKQILTLFLCLAWSATMPVSAADITAGEKKAETCGGCHGPKGNSSNPQWPNLAAQQSNYIINQLNAFKNGNRHAADGR